MCQIGGRDHLCPQRSNTQSLWLQGWTRVVIRAGLRNSPRMFHGGEATAIGRLRRVGELTVIKNPGVSGVFVIVLKFRLS